MTDLPGSTPAPAGDDTYADPALEPAPDSPVTEPSDSESAATESSPPRPSPALFARARSGPDRTAFGRVDDDGVVYVRTADGERAVGSYPGATPADALAYFGRKYDELLAALDLMLQRVTHTDLAAKEAREGFERLRAQVADAHGVGDLAVLDARLAAIEQAISDRRASEVEHRASVRAAAAEHRAELVAEAEQIAAQPEERVQWKASGARMRELLEEWKTHQRSGPRLDKEVEAQLWQRFSAARNGFDKARRSWFARLDSTHAEAKSAKEQLVAEAEHLAHSTDWSATAGAFKRLMDSWRRAGRASRAVDDELWNRFKAAQDTFFAAKDEVVAAEDRALQDNLRVKEELLQEAHSILPVTDLGQAKAALRAVQDKWERAGRVPRADLDRIERALRRVEQAVRDAEDRRWSASNPEAAARARSLVEQLDKSVAGLEQELAAARAAGDPKRVSEAEGALSARRDWLAQARAGLEEFGSA